MTKAFLSIQQIACLRRAIEQAELWRGSMVGNPDPEPIEEFDQFIVDARKALKVADTQRKVLNRIALMGHEYLIKGATR